MFLELLRGIARNIGSFILALILALVVWVSAVTVADPNVKQDLRSVPVERLGLDANLLLVGEVQNQVRLTLEAPQSIWKRIQENPALAHAWIDLTGLGPGEYLLAVKVRLDISPARLIEVEPSEIRVKIEPLLQRELPINLVISGELPLGYKASDPTLSPLMVLVTGPQSAVERVVEVRGELNISGATETVRKVLDLIALDEGGKVVSGVTLIPKTAQVTQPIELLGGFKNVVVRVITKGRVANGYRLTNISVTPPTVTLFSDDPQIIQAMPGYVDTLPVDLTNLNDDVEVNVGLNLPQGVSLVRVPSVLVQVSVAAIEGSLTLSLPVEIIGLAPGLEAQVSPETVDVIVAGPLNLLDKLTPSSFRLVLDLTGLPPGTYQRSPVVDLLPPDIRVQTTLPETLEVIITLAPTPTQSGTGTPPAPSP